MKKILLLSFLLFTLGLTSCVKGRPPVPSESTGDSTSESESESELTEYDKTVYVSFYADYNRVDLANPLVGFMWYPDQLIPAELIPDLTDIEAPAGYPEFAGWSTHTLIDDLDDLWDFAHDKVPVGVNSLDLFGIWFAEDEL